MRPPTRSPSRSTRFAATQGVGSSSRAAAPRWWPRARRRPPSPGCDKSGVSYSSANSAWITGYCNEPPFLQHSRDGGARWQQHALPRAHPSISWGGDAYPPRFFTTTNGALPADLETAHGFYDAIHTTRDAGRQWSIHRPPARTTGSTDILSADIWLVANAHTLYITSDAGPAGGQSTPRSR